MRLMLSLMLLASFVVSVHSQQCISKEDREHIRALALEGIDQGFKDKVAHLFDIWTSDLQDQPKRAIVGMGQALAAYHRARENTMKWHPPECK